MNNAKPIFGKDAIFGRLYYQDADYAALEDECDSLKNSLLAITARHFAESWKERTSDAELEQYLSAWIAQLEAERDTLRQQRDALAAELAAIKGQEPVAFYWQDIGYPGARKCGPFFGWPSESALRNVDGVAIPVPLYAMPTATQQEQPCQSEGEGYGNN